MHLIVAYQLQIGKYKLKTNLLNYQAEIKLTTAVQIYTQITLFYE